MDLDNIKKTWQEASLKPTIGEDKIRRMLDNKGQMAFKKLLKFEILGMIAAIVCMPLSLIFRNTPISIFFFCSVILILFWQIYKYRYLKKIDLVNMGVLDIYHKMMMYKRYLLAEFVICIIWVIIFALMCYFLVFLKADMARYGECSNMSIILIAIIIILPLAAAGLVYRFMYLNNIKKMEESIKELKEFKEDNI